MFFRILLILTIFILSTKIYFGQSNFFYEERELYLLRINKNENVENNSYSISSLFQTFMNNLSGFSLREITLKRYFDNDYFHLSYFPALSLEFVSPNATSVVGLDLNTFYKYQKNFEGKYARKIGDNILSLIRLANYYEKFTREEAEFYFSDTLAYVYKVAKTDKIFNWNLDFALSWSFIEWAAVEFSTEGLISVDEKKVDKTYPRRISKKIFDLTFHYYASEAFRISFQYKTGHNLFAAVSWNNYFKDFVFEIFVKGGVYSSKIKNLYSSQFGFKAKYDNFSLWLVSAYDFNPPTAYSLLDLKKKGIGELSFGKFENKKIVAGFSADIFPRKEKYIEVISFDYNDKIFSAYNDAFQTVPIAKAKIKNISKDKIEIVPEILIEELDENWFVSQSVALLPQEEKEAYFYYFFNNNKTVKSTLIGSLNARLKFEDKIQSERKHPILIYDKNSWDGKVNNLKYYAFREIDKMENLAKKALSRFRDSLSKVEPKLLKFYQAKILFDYFINQISYVSDPRAVVDRVQYPAETLLSKGGDCDDLSVLFFSLFESIGIECSFIDYINEESPSHVTIIFNTELDPEEYALITNNEKKIVLRKNEAGKEKIWIPIETTELKGFDTAWEAGAKDFYIKGILSDGLKKGIVRIVDVKN